METNPVVEYEIKKGPFDFFKPTATQMGVEGNATLTTPGAPFVTRDLTASEAQVLKKLKMCGADAAAIIVSGRR